MIHRARSVAGVVVAGSAHDEPALERAALLIMEEDPEKAQEILERVKKIAEEELANVRETLPLTEADSVLGYEPSMDYAAGREQLEWKIRQLSSVLEIDIPNYAEGIRISRSLRDADKA